MQTRFGYGRHTWAGCDRADIPSRQYEPFNKPERFVGMLKIVLPGFHLDWTLAQDMRDLRRFRAIDLDGIQHAHAAPKELLRQVALLAPTYSGATD